MEPSLAQLVAEVSELLHNNRSMENKKETIFELLRRSCLKSARDESLDTESVSDSGIKDVWTFLLILRKKSPVRKRRIDECLKALSSSKRWMRLLQDSVQLQDFVVDSDAECQTLLRPEVESFEPAVPNEVPEVKQVERPPNPFVKPAEPANPFQNTKFAGLSPKARAGSMAFSAAFEEKSLEKESQGVAKAGEQSHSTNDQSSLKEKLGQGVSMAAQATRSSVEAARDANRKYGVTEKIGQGISTAANKTVEFEREHQVSSRAMQAARVSVSAVRDANQKYGITEKMSQGAVAAYSKARDIEQKHHVTSTVASGIKNGASNVASAASSLGSKVSTKNPFSAGPEAPKNPFANGNGLSQPANPFKA